MTFALHNTIYTPTQIDEVLLLAGVTTTAALVQDRKGVEYINAPCAFDIETSSFRRGDEKLATMYMWQFGINGFAIIGRTWEEFTAMLQRLSVRLNLNAKKKLLVYVHNLSFEFQFIRRLFSWLKVFSIDLRKPIYALSSLYVEFRCSYLLSGYGLADLGRQLHKYKTSKAVGELDYELLRHTETTLTDKEKHYAIQDIFVVMCYIEELIEELDGAHNIPLTKTGFVRRFVRNECFYIKGAGQKTKPNWEYIRTIRELQIQSLDEFRALERAFVGGFTHANAEYTNEVLCDVSSYDFTSSYPFVMVSEMFPMSKGVLVEVKNIRQFEFLISRYCCVFDVELINVFAAQTQDNPISRSKCFVCENAVENNGRIVAASKIAFTTTNVDWITIRNFYTWGRLRVGRMYCYKKEYLPTPFVFSILKLYEQKTKLKGVVGSEKEYLQSKEMLNSCYGMCVTNPLREDYTYTDGIWDIPAKTPEENKEALFKYNMSKNRFLFYPWGVFVTAYARRNLFTGIIEAKDDYIYSDTDSIKLKNAQNHELYFEMYNEQAKKKLQRACAFHGLPFEMCEPRTIKGKTKLLGVWDYEGTYTRFKTLGAKRYMVQNGDDYSLTVSGVNKKDAIPFLLNMYGSKGIFDAFTNYLSLPPQATGKKVHTYIDYETSGEITDYLGNTSTFDEKSGVNLEPTGYTLNLSTMYLDYLRGIKFKD